MPTASSRASRSTSQPNRSYRNGLQRRPSRRRVRSEPGPTGRQRHRPLSATVAEMAGKRVEFLTTILPETSRVALLSNPATVRQAVTGTEAAGRTLGIQVITLSVRNTNEWTRRSRGQRMRTRTVSSSISPSEIIGNTLSIERSRTGYQLCRAARIRRRRRPYGLRTPLSRYVSSGCHVR